jgi:hypothetical protein
MNNHSYRIAVLTTFTVLAWGTALVALSAWLWVRL